MTLFYSTEIPIDSSIAPVFSHLLNWWNAARAELPFPLRSQLELSTIPDVNPWLFVAQAVGDPPDYLYRLTGSLLDTQFGMCMTGKLLSQLPVNGECLEFIRQQYAESIAELRPVLCSHAYEVDGTRDIAYQRLALPASTDGKAADLVIGAFKFGHSWVIGRGLF